MSECDSEDDGSGAGEPGAIVGLLQRVTPNVIRRSFAIKFGVVLLVMAVSIGAIGFVATETISAETSDNVQDRFRSVAEQQSELVDGWVESKRQAAQFVSTAEDYSVNDQTAIQRRLVEQKGRLGADVVSLHIVELDQGRPQLVASTSSAISSDSLQSGVRSWFADRQLTIQALGDEDVYVQSTYEPEGSTEKVVGFVSPAGTSPTGANRYLLLEASTAEISEDLRSQGRVEGGFTQVVKYEFSGGDLDPSNTTVVIDGQSGDREETLQVYATGESALEPVRESAALKATPEQSSGVITSVSGNGDVIDETYTVGYAPVNAEGLNWTVLTHAPRSSVFGFVQTVSNFGLIATAVAVLLIGIAGSGLGYSTATAIDKLTVKTEEMREGDLDVDLGTSRIDNIGQLYDGFAEMRDALKQQIQEAESARKEAEVSRAEAMEMSNYLQEKAEEYSEIMQQCGAGDLTQRMDEDGENESMDRIAAEFNDMIEELEKTTGQLKSYVDEVEEAGAEVEQSASTVREASEQVADSVQKISDDAYDQKERLQTISESMDAIAGDLEALAASGETDIDDPLESIQEIARDLSEIADLSEGTMAETENVAGAAEEQAAELNEVSERANDLQRYAQPLRDILERFETEAEHEFVFSVGPTGGSPSPDSGRTDDDD